MGNFSQLTKNLGKKYGGMLSLIPIYYYFCLAFIYNNRDNNEFRYTITFMNYGQTERNLSRYDSRQHY